MKIELEDGVPLPSHVEMRFASLPLSTMAVNQSFWVSIQRSKVARVISNRIKRNSQFAKKKFATSSEERNGIVGCRVWRIK